MINYWLSFASEIKQSIFQFFIIISWQLKGGAMMYEWYKNVQKIVDEIDRKQRCGGKNRKGNERI